MVKNTNENPMCGMLCDLIDFTIRSFWWLLYLLKHPHPGCFLLCTFTKLTPYGCRLIPDDFKELPRRKHNWFFRKALNVCIDTTYPYTSEWDGEILNVAPFGPLEAAKKKKKTSRYIYKISVCFWFSFNLFVCIYLCPFQHITCLLLHTRKTSGSYLRAKLPCANLSWSTTHLCKV